MLLSLMTLSLMRDSHPLGRIDISQAPQSCIGIAHSSRPSSRRNTSVRGSSCAQIRLWSSRRKRALRSNGPCLIW